MICIINTPSRVPDYYFTQWLTMTRHDSVFRALADPTRREMIRLLATREQTVTEIAAPFQMSPAVASKVIKVPERAGRFHRTVRGGKHLCRLDPKALAAIHEWIRFYERFRTERIDALERERKQV